MMQGVSISLRDQLEQEALEVVRALMRDDNPNLRMHAAMGLLQVLAAERARNINMQADFKGSDGPSAARP